MRVSMRIVAQTGKVKYPPDICIAITGARKQMSSIRTERRLQPFQKHLASNTKHQKLKLPKERLTQPTLT